LSETVRYDGGNNAVLRLVLHTVWGQRCYWCNRPKDYNDIQIDHIVPRSQGLAGRHEILDAHRLSHIFDVDNPRNLAPICARCNGPNGKGGEDLTKSRLVVSVLHHAETFRPRVIRMVTTFGNGRRTAEHLLKAIETDLTDPRARQAFEDHAPAIVQKLAMMDESKADYEAVRIVELERGGLDPVSVRLLLNSRARTTLTIVEEFCAADLTAILDEGIAAVLDQTARRAADGLRGRRHPAPGRRRLRDQRLHAPLPG
jgi:hypothetical protein